MSGPLDPVLDTLSGVLSAATGGGLGLLFLSAAVAKVRGWPAFVGVVGAYRLAPAAASPILAPVLLAAEAAAGLALFAAQPRGFQLAAGLLGLFSAALAINLLRGRTHIECGCEFGGRGQGVRWSLVVRNSALAALAIWASREPPSFGAIWAIGVLSGGTIYILCLARELLARGSRPPTARGTR